MKKQIITIASVALAAVLLFVAYSIFFTEDNDDITIVDDPYTTVSDELKTAVSKVEQPVELLLSGYDSADKYWEWVYLSADTLESINGNISASTQNNGDFVGVRITVGDKSKDIKFDELFKMKYTTKYGYNGWSVICNGIFAMCGMEEMNIAPVIFEGYNEKGDIILEGNKVFVFPAVDRSNISYLTINNEHGEYSIFQSGGTFYFDDSRAITYNDESFSLLTTNCRYPVSYGIIEMPQDKTWASYGLSAEGDIATDDEITSAEKQNISYSLITAADKNGVYYIHTVIISKKMAASGSYHYGRYIGGVFKSSNDENVGDTMLENLSSDSIYLIPASSVQTIAQPKTDFMNPTIVNPVTDTEKLFNIGNIRIDYYDQGISSAAKNILNFSGASNLASASSSGLTKLISDKISVSDYSKYLADGKSWQDRADVFAAFTSSDGNDTAIIGSLARHPEKGNYKVKFGLVRHEVKGAYLPAKVTLEKSYDGINWHPVENGEVSPEQEDKTIKHYEISFTDADVVTFVRLSFGVPQIKETYVVFDEIRIYADDYDAQPANAITGRWKLVSPEEYIPKGYNYAYVDMTNFNNFVQWFSSLEGEKVVDCGFAADGDASPANIDHELLAKYGLDQPNRHYSYEVDGVITDLYVSAPTEDGIYYAYSTYSGEHNGEDVLVTTDVIVQLTTKSAQWLDWEFMEFLDHSLLAIYINDMDGMDITYNGEAHEFTVVTDDDGATVTDIVYKGKSYDVKSFAYLYQAVLSISMKDEYVPEEGEEPTEYLRIKIHSETNSPEIVFYKISATRCYYTVDGEGSYYAHTSDVNQVIDRLERYIAGEIITK